MAVKEIDLLPPAIHEPVNLPTPVCPQGVVSATGEVGEGFEEPPLPGESPLDQGLEELTIHECSQERAMKPVKKVEASKEAKLLAATILDVLAGVRHHRRRPRRW